MRAGRFDGRRTGVVVEGRFDAETMANVGGTASGSLSVTGDELGTGVPNSEACVT